MKKKKKGEEYFQDKTAYNIDKPTFHRLWHLSRTTAKARRSVRDCAFPPQEESTAVSKTTIRHRKEHYRKNAKGVVPTRSSLHFRNMHKYRREKGKCKNYLPSEWVELWYVSVQELSTRQRRSRQVRRELPFLFIRASISKQLQVRLPCSAAFDFNHSLRK